MYIMGKEPVPGKTAADVRSFFADKLTEKDLADAFAVAFNQFWWVEDNIYDFEKGTPEYIKACSITDEWGALMDEYEKRIFEILINEGISIPDTGRIAVLAPFMKRNGYDDGNGWWIKQEVRNS